MNGRDLAQQVISLYPEIVCLFMSGYSGAVMAHHGILDKGVNFIEKPFSMQDLAVKVRQVLEAG
jgi:two-component system, cell cycle sensor histidine kinase and response regulator CckA